MTQKINIIWFRRDLRLYDNPALYSAHLKGPILALYTHYDPDLGKRSQWWLSESLKSMQQDLPMHYYKGHPLACFIELLKTHAIESINWNMCFEPDETDLDQEVIEFCQQNNIQTQTHQRQLLWDPSTVLNQSGLPYKVFTPFYRKGCMNAAEPEHPIGKTQAQYITLTQLSSEVETLGLYHDKADHQQLSAIWEPSESAAHKRSEQFLNERVNQYKKDRDFPGIKGTSHLSPYLHFGQITPHQLWHRSIKMDLTPGIDTFLSELGWREFSYYLLYHFPTFATENFNRKFDQFPWLNNDKELKAWQQGQTGIPIVDAGMRELLTTGTMHNRLRMITASFLTKNLLHHWHEGQDWFWENLVDADLASNAAGWQWVAGSGADASPYFRVFNPGLQGEKFDKDATYIKKYVPELRDVPAKMIHKIWDMSDEQLSPYLKIGIDYPRAIVDLKVTRNRALDAWGKL
ncbi:DNA photolyase family protein [Candidatus Comchoanobacter bicostacola]|uniref:DNA photolyase family protein n=1 Tax=Candidatus Comchoanobacter bicostacola TaxID=2919598 RepID=A0ABY5DKL1_9GAMM|nr:deoxyribodipyrimidine photo-lyase [Candidatus Comchoanobacter bicostacola]UTC24352.1 DNA photolyase family protein [Candidatus Comchoanobacter bicostacola]